MITAQINTRGPTNQRISPDLPSNPFISPTSRRSCTTPTTGPGRGQRSLRKNPKKFSRRSIDQRVPPPTPPCINELALFVNSTTGGTLGGVFEGWVVVSGFALAGLAGPIFSSAALALAFSSLAAFSNHSRALMLSSGTPRPSNRQHRYYTCYQRNLQQPLFHTMPSPACNLGVHHSRNSKTSQYCSSHRHPRERPPFHTRSLPAYNLEVRHDRERTLRPILFIA